MDAIQARQIIRTLRAGVVTRASAKAISVGSAEMERVIRKHLTDFSRQKNESSLLLLQGDWGSGKSHHRMLCQQIVEDLGLPSIQHCVDGAGGSLAHAHRCISTWLSECTVGTTTGLPSAFDYGLLDRDKSLAWCASRYGSFEFGLSLVLDGMSWGWFTALGHQFATPDYGYQRDKALAVLHSSASYMTAMDKSGFVLLLDELENVTRQWDIRGRRKSYDTLERLSRDPSFFVIAFITSRFLRQVQEDAAVGLSRQWDGWSREARHFVSRIHDIEVLHLPALSDASGMQIVKKISSVYDQAYKGSLSSHDTERIVTHWKRTATRSVRLLVRSAIMQLDFGSH
jgi:hypothetical protein